MSIPSGRTFRTIAGTAIIPKDRARADITRKSRETGGAASARIRKHVPGLTMRRNDGGDGGGIKEFAGTMRHRELRETVSLAQLGRTRAPLYSALLPLLAVTCGDPVTKAFLVFDTANCTHPPTHPPFLRALPLVLVSLSNCPFPLYRWPSAEKQTERLSMYASI